VRSNNAYLGPLAENIVGSHAAGSRTGSSLGTY